MSQEENKRKNSVSESKDPISEISERWGRALPIFIKDLQTILSTKEVKPPQKKKIKQENKEKAKKPQNGYNFFVREFREEHKTDNPKNLMVDAAKAWKSLNESQQAEYKVKSKEAFDREMEKEKLDEKIKEEEKRVEEEKDKKRKHKHKHKDSITDDGETPKKKKHRSSEKHKKNTSDDDVTETD